MHRRLKHKVAQRKLSDVTDTMLLVKNKSIALLWELNSKLNCINMAALSRGYKPRIRLP